MCNKFMIIKHYEQEDIIVYHCYDTRVRMGTGGRTWKDY